MVERLFKILKHRLRRDGISDLDLLYAVREGVTYGARVGITDEKSLVRLVELQLRAPPALLGSPAAMQALVAVLTNARLESGERLDFVDRNILGRRPPGEDA